MPKDLPKKLRKSDDFFKVIKIIKGIENCLVLTRKMMPLAKETKMLEVVVCEFLNFSLCLILKISTVAVSVCVCVCV